MAQKFRCIIFLLLLNRQLILILLQHNKNSFKSKFFFSENPISSALNIKQLKSAFFQSDRKNFQSTYCLFAKKLPCFTPTPSHRYRVLKSARTVKQARIKMNKTTLRVQFQSESNSKEPSIAFSTLYIYFFNFQRSRSLRLASRLRGLRFNSRATLTGYSQARSQDSAKGGGRGLN